MLPARHSSTQVSSVITITGLGDHNQPDWLITMTGIRIAVAKLVFTSTEIALLDRLIPHRKSARPRSGTLSSYLTKVAQLGGYMARAKDPPPGNIVMWRGLSRLTDIKLGATLAKTPTKCG
jgi:hypothetical protein